MYPSDRLKQIRQENIKNIAQLCDHATKTEEVHK